MGLDLHTSEPRAGEEAVALSVRHGAEPVSVSPAQYPYVVLLVAIIICSLYAGLAGIDFGKHWDEEAWFLIPLRRSFESKTLLPGYYDYGSVPYTLTVFPAIAKAVHHFATTPARVTDQNLTAFAQSAFGERFGLILRREFLVISQAALLWVALLAFWLRRSWRTAAFAALFLAASWEFMYHARWIAVDTLMAQFAALTFLLLYVSIARQSLALLRAAAVAGACALGCKWPAGLLLVPLLAAVFIVIPRGNGRRRFRELWIVTAVFFGAFLVTTPGALFQPFYFVRSIVSQARHYATGHGNHTVAPGLTHLGLMLNYLAQVALSRYRVLAVAGFVLALAGGVAFWRERKWESLPLLGFVAVYLGYFCCQRVMIVRNLMVLIPLLAVTAALGWDWVTASIRRASVRAMLDVAMILALAAGLVWQVSAARGIAQRRTIDHRANLAGYLQSPRGEGSFVTPEVTARYTNSGHISLGEARYVVFDSKERPDWTRLRANMPGRYHFVSSIYDCNYDYYPDWDGDERLVAVDKAMAFRIGIVH